MTKLVESLKFSKKTLKNPSFIAPSLQTAESSKELSESIGALLWFTNPELVDWDVRNRQLGKRWLALPNELKEEERLDVEAIRTGVRRASRYSSPEAQRFR